MNSNNSITRNIIALGGGGFSMEPDNPLLDKYILATANKPQPKICFLATASGDAEGYIQRFYFAFEQEDCTPSHLSLFNGHTKTIADFILEQDIIYVGGGNTRNLLILWQAWGLDKALKQAYQNGTILCGISAGAMCWFEQGLTDSYPTELRALDCLGLLSGSSCPHFNGEAFRQEHYKNLILSGNMKAGIAADDSVALHYQNEQLFKIVASEQDVFAHKFKMNGVGLIYDKLVPEYLG